jgi:cytochrome b
MPHRIRVWDLPTRLFHWALVGCIVASVVTGYQGGPTMDLHARIGYAVLTLLLFRLVWGFIGGRWSRFAAFPYSPRAVINYLRGTSHPDHLVGHNPLGAGAIFAMLVFLLAQIATGLIGDDETAFTGPLNKFVSNARGLAATWYHKRVGQWILVGLIALHVAAVLYYLWRKKQNLIKPMWDGDKELDSSTVPSRDDAVSRLTALAVLGLCAGLVAWIVQLGS